MVVGRAQEPGTARARGRLREGTRMTTFGVEGAAFFRWASRGAPATGALPFESPVSSLEAR